MVLPDIALLRGRAGTVDSSIAVWSVEKHEAVAQWTGVKALNSALKWSPRRMLVASADSVLALWVPNKKLLQSTGRWPVMDAHAGSR